MNLSGYVKGWHRRNGELLHRFEGKNLVVDAGRTLIKDIVSSTGGVNKPTHLALGSDGTAVTASDTALASEVGVTREPLSDFETAFTLTYYCTQATGIDNDDAQHTIRELGIFNAGAAGTMLARFLCQAFIFELGDDLVVNWILTFGD